MKHSIAQALLIASVFWLAAIVVAVAADGPRPRPSTLRSAASTHPAEAAQTAQAEPDVEPGVASTRDDSRESAAQPRDSGGGMGEQVPAAVEPTPAPAAVTSRAAQRAAGSGSSSRGSSAVDKRVAAPRSPQDADGTTPTTQSKQAPPAATDPPAPKADPPAAKVNPPAPKAEPPAPKADPPTANDAPTTQTEPDPPAPKADPPVAKREPPGKAKPPAAKPDPPAAKPDPPAAKDPSDAEGPPPGKARPPKGQLEVDEDDQGSD